MLANDDYFQRRLAFGQVGESLIARFLRSRKWIVNPCYEKKIDNGKGPRLFLPFGANESMLITPDIQAMRDRQVRWFDVKHKSTGTYFRKNSRWQTGIDRRHYLDYVKVRKLTQWPVWLLFLQRESTITNAPPDVEPCPTGLFGCPITQPYSDTGWYTSKGRRYDMVYWGIEELKPLATLQEVLDGAASSSDTLRRPSNNNTNQVKQDLDTITTSDPLHEMKHHEPDLYEGDGA
jgi:hypothetical protein